MKQVSKTEPSIITPEKCSSLKSYGVYNQTYKLKGFVTRQEFQDGDYKFLSIRSLTEGNGFMNMNSPSLQELIEKGLKNFTIYQFDTERELFTWLAQ